MERRTFLRVFPLSLLFLVPGVVHGAGKAMAVYKNPWCDCCHGWAEAMRRTGYSVTTTDVAAAIKSAGGPLVEKRAIEIDGHIKTLGDYPVRISLHPDVVATITVHVISV